MTLPVITLYQPWATWIIRGWKPIETRTHSRFAALKGKTICIHSGMKTDNSAIANPYLTMDQILHNPDEMINGYILGTAFVHDFGKLDDSHSKDALIECVSVQRWGLFLSNIERIDPIKVPGEMGIWYYDFDKREKVRINHTINPPSFTTVKEKV